jgi:hypothetical protein
MVFLCRGCPDESGNRAFAGPTDEEALFRLQARLGVTTTHSKKRSIVWIEEETPPASHASVLCALCSAEPVHTDCTPYQVCLRGTPRRARAIVTVGGGPNL